MIFYIYWENNWFRSKSAKILQFIDEFDYISTFSKCLDLAQGMLNQPNNFSFIRSIFYALEA